MCDEPRILFYDDVAVDRIIEAVGRGGLPPGQVPHHNDNARMIDRRDKLSWWLNEIALCDSNLARFDGEPRPSLDKTYELLKNATETFKNVLLDKNVKAVLPYAEGDDPTQIRFGIGDENDTRPPEPNIQVIMFELDRVVAWASWHCQKVNAPSKRHGGARPALHDRISFLLPRFGNIYKHIFHKDPRFSTTARKTSGPFSGFLDTCFRPLLGEDTPTPDALRQQWRRHEKSISEVMKMLYPSEK